MIVCVFDSLESAEATRMDLRKRADLDDRHVRLTRRERPDRAAHEEEEDDEGFWGSIRSHFNITSPENDAPDNSVGAVLTIIASPQQIAGIIEIIKQHEPITIDSRMRLGQLDDPDSS